MNFFLFCSYYIFICIVMALLSSPAISLISIGSLTVITGFLLIKKKYFLTVLEWISLDLYHLYVSNRKRDKSRAQLSFVVLVILLGVFIISRGFYQMRIEGVLEVGSVIFYELVILVILNFVMNYTSNFLRMNDYDFDVYFSQVLLCGIVIGSFTLAGLLIYV